VAIFKVNSFEVPVASCRFGEVEIGSRGRSFRGKARQSIRAAKRQWRITTPPLAQEMALAVRGMLRGAGVSWGFDVFVEPYSDNGLWPEAGMTTAALSAAQKKYGLRSCYFAVGQQAGWCVGVEPRWSCLHWRRVAGVWHHYLIRDDGVKALNGAQAAPDTAYCSYSSATGVLAFTAPTEAYYLDDLVWLPFRLPVAWATAIYDRNAAFPARPSVELVGDLVGATALVRGELDDGEAEQAAVNGVWVDNLLHVGATLTEE
jgi:hypothetical protein